MSSTDPRGETPVGGSELARVRGRFAELARQRPGALRRRPWVRARPAGGLAVDIDFEQYGRNWAFRSDEAVERGGGDTGPSPMRYFLSGLASCIIGWTTKVAEERGLVVTVVTLELRTMLDMRGEAGLADVPVHPLWIICDVELAPATAPSAHEVLREALRRCPLSALASAAAPLHLIIRNGDDVLLDERPDTIRTADEEELTR